MTIPPPFQGWYRLAQFLLEPRDLAQIIEPTMADAWHERTLTQRRRSWLWRSHFHLCSALLVAIMGNAWLRLRRASWLGFLALLLAGLSGAVTLRQEANGSAALRQCWFLAVGALLGILVVSIPTKLLRSLGSGAIVVAVAALMLCPWFGVQYDGARAWLRLGSLQIHTATLCLPAFVAFVNRTGARSNRGWWAVGTAVALCLILLEHDWQIALVYVLTACSAWIERRTLNRVYQIVGLLVVSAAIPSLSSQMSAWSCVGAASLCLAIGWGIFRERARDATDAMPQLGSVAMVTLAAMRELDGDPLPVVGFGGSAIAACFVLLALGMRANLIVTTEARHQ